MGIWERRLDLAGIMIQGTMSGAGKSLMVAALCRIFMQDGLSAAPFKSQNMALNSYVTSDGLEMGRAQAVQAYAAGKLPDARMNPILLKPQSTTGSQLILNGRPAGDYGAAEYFKMRNTLVPDIMKAYRELSSENDIVVIEGAGSPAEINLKSGDIVNMGLAELADVKVLLVGNIDPGGVFAQLFGTLMLLSEKEKERVKGFIINKFRGDKTLLEPGLSELSGLTGKPVLGVVPYMELNIEEEDSLSERLSEGSHIKPVDIAVIRLPFISNYTDFAPFERSRLSGVRFVEDPLKLGRPDLIILPGSKSTIEDLRWLKESGLFAAILSLFREGTDLLGICGGYQMMGEAVNDPLTGIQEEGLRVFPISTVFKPEKRTKQLSGTILNGPFKGVRVSGYEIHHGETLCIEGGSYEPFSSLETLSGEKCLDGAFLGNASGTYLHGLFESGELIRKMSEHYLKKRGISGDLFEDMPDFRRYQEEQYDKLADTVRKNIDLEAVYRIAGLRV